MKQELQWKKEKAVAETPAREDQKDQQICTCREGECGDGKVMIAIVSSGRRVSRPCWTHAGLWD